MKILFVASVALVELVAQAQGFCFLEYGDPVCSSNNVTYFNDCFATAEMPEGASVACATACPCVDEASQDGGVFCSAVFDPVCGIDGETYANDCFAAQAIGDEQPVQCQGECPCEPATFCTLQYSPVCAEGCVTFQNQCWAAFNNATVVATVACDQVRSCNVDA